MATEIASAYIKLIPSTGGIKQSLEKELGASGNAAGEAASKSIWSKVGGVAKKVGAAALTATAAAAAGFAALSKQALDYYSDYEQLTGGIETLFGAGGATIEEYAASAGKSVAEVEGEYGSLTAAQDAVFANAANAYKTAGLSANEYMETATSFAASLVSGLGGDTEEAARLADVAITDMADNANKMGTDISAIQNAYQGFAKQNYTMLDNLKLGYGGTASEMARLINDSGVLGDSMTVTADTVNSVSFDKMIEAIHTVQDTMGITGTTAKEAASTIQGSVASMKASWANWLTGMADEEQDAGELTNQLVESVKTAASNIIPRLQVILPTLASGLSQLVTELTPYVGEAVQLLLPSVIDGAVGLVNGLVGALPGVISVLIEVLPTLIESLLETIGTQLPLLINSIISSLAAVLPSLISSITSGIVSIATSLTAPENLATFIQAGLDLLLGLAQGIAEALPQLAAAIPVIISNIVTSLVGALPLLTPAAIEIIFALINGILAAMPELMAAMPNIILGIVQGILDNLPTIILAAPNIIIALATGIVNAIPQLIAVIPQLIMSIVDTFTSYDWANIGKNIVTGIKNGFLQMWENLKAVVRNMVQGVVSLVKGILKIRSPSKVFEEIGGRLPQGMVNGTLGGVDDVKNAARLMAEGAVSEAQRVSGIAAVSTTVSGYTPANYTATSSNQTTLDRLETVISALADRMGSLQVVLDDGTLVGVIAPSMDRALGRRTVAAARGY